jgi:Uma2 family endonuclease
MGTEVQAMSATSAATARRTPYVSYEEFLNSGIEGHYEWVDGDVIKMSPVSGWHQLQFQFLIAILTHFVEWKKAGLVMSAPFQMKLEMKRRGREPDLIFVRADRLEKMKKNHFDGPADLAVEIVSPESVVRDRVEKFHEYEESGVREFWLLDSEGAPTEFYTLGADSRYEPIPVGEDGIFRSIVLPGFWLDVTWLAQPSLPPIMDVLRAWGLV